ncbi:L,D-transpeptidase/peptidoglycan binding protein [Pediococcus ethanolidurans]|uniref:L,D-transpeptidase family protein n=1 Tax=Pediococcus ethanolidurans TaxID=319653 RepID=UPI001C1EE820|nr:L,D-transpeptidase family protein [Pediococcus ethanolidurans]MBU7555493.1 peptidoglycan binding domain-containing protein [Pediococcus ethanolidurans]MBU7564225.1 peptidoglycan binding domain-containing protein [Pediococcus ethanolidurans]MCV3315886.1 L,D-transpeptidase/peptidoglycan binding protein [Pediococcus ethanolidurans]MCV3321913.1 L,D-transpeptidase/peptidoglycan binding protein [Pediococcus ethanolidurans]MCV3324199.1 L,D-transpeptidase/peptidoglycan binding protein [Pediococcus 
MRHKSRSNWRIVGILAAILLIIYGIGTFYFATNNHFLPNTKVAGVNVGNKSVSQASTAITKQLANRKFSITQNGKTLTSFSTKQIGLKLQSTTALKTTLQKQSVWSWPLHLINVASAATTTALTTTQSQKQLKKLVNQEVTKLNKNRTAGTSGKLQINNGQVKLSKGTQGNQIDANKLTAKLKKALASGATTLAITKSVYASTVTGSDAQIAKKAETIINEKATYNVGGYKFTIPKSEIAKWLTYQNGKLGLNSTLVRAYVSKVNTKYKTYGKTKTFKSTLRGTVSVSGGFYGWSLKVDDETAALSTEILKGKDFTRQPIIQGTGYNTNKQVIGNTYVEVDKKNQKMFIYVNGKLKLKTNVVTGLPPKQTTTTGVWSVWAKKRNATLRGSDLDGTKYATKVSYWMPIDDTGIGIHDASWQPTFGGTWYKTHGSNGCINTPPSVMPKVYKLVALGTPVIVF